MEPAHRTKLRRQFGPCLKHARVVCLDIPDRYGFMDPALVALLEVLFGGLSERDVDYCSCPRILAA